MQHEARSAIERSIRFLRENDGKLSLTGKQIGDEGLRYLTQQLSANGVNQPNAISILDLGQCGLTDNAIPALLRLLRKGGSLRQLSLQGNHFTPEGLEKLIPALQDLPFLQKLDVSQNATGPEGGRVVAECIRTLPALREVQAHHMDLCDAGLAAVADAAAAAPHLRRINLSINRGTSACLPSLRGMILGHRWLTHIHLTQNHVPLDDGVRQAFRDALNVNQLYVSPTNGPVAEHCEQHRQQARRAAHLLQKAPEDLDYGQYAFVARRFSAAQEPDLLRNFGLPNDYIAGRYERLFQRMPTLPGAGPEFGDALFAVNADGFAPLDNPHLWQDADALFARLETSGTVLSRAFLDRTTPNGQSFLRSAAAMLPLEELLPRLNRQGIRLRAGDLLDGDGKPNTLLQAFLEQGTLQPLFRKENWYGASAEELHRLHEAIPQAQRGEVPLHALRHSIRLPGAQGVGR